MGTVVGAATDYLVTHLGQLVVAAQADCLVIDANTNDEKSDTIVWIGRRAPQDTTGGAAVRGLPVMGSRRVDETWTIDCFIDAKRDGTDQKTSRDAAVSVYDVVCRLVSTDPTLGGLLTFGYPAEIRAVSMLYPDPPATAQSRTVISFSVLVKNRYNAA